MIKPDPDSGRSIHRLGLPARRFAAGRYRIFPIAFVLLILAIIMLAPVPAGALFPERTVRVSTDSTGGEAQGPSYSPAVSADGRMVAFHSGAANLVQGDDNGRYDVFVKDALNQVVICASTDSSGNVGTDHSYNPAISADGRWVAFESDADFLQGGDTNNVRDIYLKDIQTGNITRVSTDSSGNEAGAQSLAPSISADGRYVAFESDAANLVAFDDNNRKDVFLKDTQTGATVRVSTDSNGHEGMLASYNPAVSADGRWVAFESDADLLSTGNDTNNARDIYVKDTQTGVTTRVSTDSGGGESNNHSFAPAISAGGRYVAFESDASDLVGADLNGKRDIFTKDTQTGAVTRTGGNGNSYAPAITADGGGLAFESDATNLVGGDTNGLRDIFTSDSPGGSVRRLSYAPGGAEPAGNSYAAAVSADGRYVAFESLANNLWSWATPTWPVTSSWPRTRRPPWYRPVQRASWGTTPATGSRRSLPPASSWPSSLRPPT